MERSGTEWSGGSCSPKKRRIKPLLNSRHFLDSSHCPDEEEGGNNAIRRGTGYGTTHREGEFDSAEGDTPEIGGMEKGISP